MARVTSNGAVVANNGYWYWDGWKWVALVQSPPEKAPGLFSPERLGLITVMKGMSLRGMKEAGEELARLTTERGGSLREAEAASLQSQPSLAMDKLDERAAKLLASSLSGGEVVLGCLNGIRDSQALVLTDERALIIKVGFMSGQSFGGKVTSFEYRNITSVEVRVSMMTGSFEIAAGGVSGAERSYWGGKQKDAWHAPNAIPIGKPQMASFQQAAAVIRERSRAISQPAPTAPANTPNIPDQIKQLAGLRDAGILSEEEFARKKAELLSRL